MSDQEAVEAAGAALEFYHRMIVEGVADDIHAAEFLRREADHLDDVGSGRSTYIAALSQLAEMLDEKSSVETRPH